MAEGQAVIDDEELKPEVELIEEMMEADIMGWVVRAARLNKPILVHPLRFSLDQGRPCLFCWFPFLGFLISSENKPR